MLHVPTPCIEETRKGNNTINNTRHHTTSTRNEKWEQGHEGEGSLVCCLVHLKLGAGSNGDGAKCKHKELHAQMSP
jgi:hypothetical protein